MEVNAILILCAICWTDSRRDTQATHIWHQPHWFNYFFISWMRLLQTSSTSLTLSTSITTKYNSSTKSGMWSLYWHASMFKIDLYTNYTWQTLSPTQTPSLSQGKWPSRQTSTTGGRKRNNQWITFTYKLHLRKSKPCLGIWVITCGHKAKAMTLSLAISACRREV